MAVTVPTVPTVPEVGCWTGVVVSRDEVTAVGCVPVAAPGVGLPLRLAVSVDTLAIGVKGGPLELPAETVGVNALGTALG